MSPMRATDILYGDLGQRRSAPEEAIRSRISCRGYEKHYHGDGLYLVQLYPTVVLDTRNDPELRTVCGDKILSGSGELHIHQGLLHRSNGPAIDLRDYKAWYQHGQLHNEDGPAKTWFDGDAEWYQQGLLHRIDGPAIIHADGRKEWWIEGTPCADELDWNRLVTPFIC